MALLLPLAVLSTSAETVTGPSLTPGDTWTYRTNTSFATGFFLDGQVTLTVFEHTAITIEGATFDAYRIRVTGSGTAAGTFTTQLGSAPASGAWMLTGEATVESRGLKTIGSVLDLEANATLHTQPVGIDFQLSVQNTTMYRLVEDAWRFPLAVETSTVVRSEMSFSEDVALSFGFPTTPIHTSGLAAWNVTYALEASAPVDTPAGHFIAYRIRQTYPDGTVNVFFYAPTAGNNARTETYNGTEPVATTELISYRYQALEPARLLGLTMSDWAILAALAVAGTTAVLFVRRRKRRPAQPSATPPPTPPAAP